MRKPSPAGIAMIIAVVALFVSLGGVGAAANGANLILGRSNTASKNTVLTAPVVGGKTLQLTNTNTTNAASTALGLNVAAGHAPFMVNSGVKVANLNADMVDGFDSSSLQQRISGTCSSGAAIQSIASNGAVACQNTGGSEAWHLIAANTTNGCANDGTFCADHAGCAWHNSNPGFSSAAYYRDPTGVVHLRGDVQRPPGCTGPYTPVIFVLPVGYRPASGEIFAAVASDQAATVYINDPNSFTGGSVRHQSGGDPTIYVSLDGISFRCEPAGVNGCP